jgi:hypothetical protein
LVCVDEAVDDGFCGVREEDLVDVGGEFGLGGYVW